MIGNGVLVPSCALTVFAVKLVAVALATITVSCAAPVSMTSAAPG